MRWWGILISSTLHIVTFQTHSIQLGTYSLTPHHHHHYISSGCLEKQSKLSSLNRPSLTEENLHIKGLASSYFQINFETFWDTNLMMTPQPGRTKYFSSKQTLSPYMTILISSNPMRNFKWNVSRNFICHFEAHDRQVIQQKRLHLLISKFNKSFSIKWKATVWLMWLS